MNRVVINTEALRHNLDIIRGWVEGQHGAKLTVVTKVLCGHVEAIRAFHNLGVRSMADSRLQNLRAIREGFDDVETWYLLPPSPSVVSNVVTLANVSLNTELSIIRALNQEAGKQDTVHGVVIMIELGDLREGILPGTLVKIYEEIFNLPNIRILGIGANLGCLSGAVPNVDQFMQLVLYRELLELKFDRKLPLISAGASAVLPLLVGGVLPRQINHFRIGESILLGTDLVNGGKMEGLRDDAVLMEAEIIEIKEKALVPLGETGSTTPFTPIEEAEQPSPGQRGYRALVALGQLDTEVGALMPVHPDHTIAGASSDITVVNLGEQPHGLGIGDTIRFKMKYSALVRAMNSKYSQIALPPPLEEIL